MAKYRIQALRYPYPVGDGTYRSRPQPAVGLHSFVVNPPQFVGGFYLTQLG